MVLYVFQFYPVCNFGNFINFGLGTVRSERVKLEVPGDKCRCNSSAKEAGDPTIN